ncbi:MAG TPA: hypothetical protein VG817_05055, partial [Gemmatimonadales bacterium]|nr:hypothetical protein [Gemmatimonadales bacterium]
PYLHESGVPTLALIVGAVVAFALFQVILGLLLRLVPVRCGLCRHRAGFTRFGWWPFIYRFACRSCGAVVQHEVRGR